MTQSSERAALHPPKARLTLRVGVTGHRLNRLEQADLPALRRHVRETLEATQKAVVAWHKDNPALFSEDPPLFRLISSLAEGADRIAADEALSLGWELQCPLPFFAEEYTEDFRSVESKETFRQLLGRATAVMELDGSRNRSSEAYLAAGNVVLNQCDILLAIWDGRPPHGEGGTGQIAEESLRRNTLVVWIDAQAPHPARLLVKLDNMPSPNRTATEETDWDLLKKWIERLLQPPDASTDSETGSATEDREDREAYFAKKQPRWTLGFSWLLFRDFFADFKLRMPKIKVADFQNSTREAWEQDIKKVPSALEIPKIKARQWEQQWRESSPVSHESEARVAASLREHYCWADNLATYYSDLYRSSFVVGYLFSALSVLSAMVGAGLSVLGGHSASFATLETPLVVFEVLIMVTVLLSWHSSQRFHWHDCWIDYRLLAECLRVQRFLTPLGVTLPSPRLADRERSQNDPRETWMFWHFRAIVRQAGLMPVRLDAAYLDTYRIYLWKNLVMDQWAYHRQSVCGRLHRLHRHLHILETSLIWIVIASAACHLLPVHFGGFPFTMILAAVCPAFSAAFYAIGVQVEIARLIKRSQVMCRQLERAAYQLSEPDAARSSQTLFQAVAPIVERMIAEHLDWRSVIQEREWTPV
jgi:hypothetical protein